MKEFFTALKNTYVEDMVERSTLRKVVRESVKDERVASLMSEGIINAKHDILDLYSTNVDLREWATPDNLSALRFLVERAMKANPKRKFRLRSKVNDAAFDMLFVYASFRCGHELRLAEV